MKKLFALMLGTVMVLSLGACSQGASSNDAGSTASSAATKTSINYMSVDELNKLLGTEGYTILDVRKAADFQTSHIPGSISADMDAAVQGDEAAGVSTMTPIAKEHNDNLVVVCYSGKRYAEATTKALQSLGYDMSKVITLEGGFKAWNAAYPDKVSN